MLNQDTLYTEVLWEEEKTDRRQWITLLNCWQRESFSLEFYIQWKYPLKWKRNKNIFRKMKDKRIYYLQTCTMRNTMKFFRLKGNLETWIYRKEWRATELIILGIIKEFFSFLNFHKRQIIVYSKSNISVRCILWYM